MRTGYDLAREARSAYLDAAELWRGCDWPTSFGCRGMDLAGLKARQTRLLAEATSGEESQAWAEATYWLERIEQDARDARAAASLAIDQLDQQQWESALVQINEACTLESQYHTQLVWGPLRNLIAAGAERHCERGSVG